MAMTSCLQTCSGDPGSNNLLFGFDGLYVDETSGLLFSKEMRDQRIRELAYLLRLLAEAVGVVRTRNPEVLCTHPVYEQDPVTEEVEDLVSRIETSIGALIDFPNPYPNEHGILTSRGVVSHRAYHGIYQASLLKTLARYFGDRILEIGAGLGRTAYYAIRFGLRNYTIVDLPLANVAQASFLGMTSF